MNLGDKKAWDDSELINTWDEALEEYKVSNHDYAARTCDH